MRRRGLLVRFPADPFCLDSLMPDFHAAALAEQGCCAGHEVEVVDFGTAAVRTTLIPESARRYAERWFDQDWAQADRGSLIKSISKLRGPLIAKAFCRARIVAGERYAEWLPLPADYILFFVHTPEDFEVAWAMALEVRRSAPRTHLALTGSLVSSWRSSPQSIPRQSNVFECLFEPTIAGCYTEWAEQSSIEQRSNGATRMGPDGFPQFWDPSEPLHLGSAPSYDPMYYPALAQTGAKFRLLPVSDCIFSKNARPSGQSILLLDAIRNPMKHHGTSAYHFELTKMDGPNLAVSLLRSGITVTYSCNITARALNANAPRLLRASGCQAVEYRIETGSQRLLEDYYHSSIGVSAWEEILRNSRQAGLNTSIGLTYPCPHDDYHTREETLRLVNRTRPHGVTMRFLPKHPVNAVQSLFWEDLTECDLHRTLGMMNRAGRHMQRLQDLLAKQLVGQGVAVGCPAYLALVARALGEDTDMMAFKREIVRMLYTDDQYALSDMIGRFNEVTQPIESSHLEGSPGAFLQAAVGN